MKNTTVNAIEMVKAAGLENAGEIRLFAMETKEVTVPVLEAALDELMVAYKKSSVKIEKADLFARAMEMEVGMDEDFVAELEAMTAPKGEVIEVNGPVGSVGASAAGETPVAENKTEEETVMNPDKVMQEIINKRNQKAMENSPLLKRVGVSSLDMIKGHTGYENTAATEMMSKVTAMKDKYLENVGELPVVVEVIEFYPTEEEVREELEEAGWNESKINRHIRKLGAEKKIVREIELAVTGNKMRFIGEITVRMPEEYAQVKVWNPRKVNSKGRLGAPEFVDFADYDLNLVKRQFNMRRPLAAGSGLVVLSIYEFEDAVTGEVSLPQASLPTEKGKDGRRWPIFQTADVRFAKTKDAERPDQPLYLSDNNENFNAQVSAFIQMYTNEFVQGNPKNHHGFNKKNCVNMIRFQTKDGVMDDEHMESKKSRVILEQPDVMQLAQVGSEQPNTYCTVYDKFLDIEAVEILNDAEKADRSGAMGRDEDGEERYQRHDEITIAGKLVKRNTVRETIIEKNCANCPFFCGNAPKSESQVAKEKVADKEAGGSGFAPAFYRERPKAKAQAVQTEVMIGGQAKWVTKFPYEVLGKVDDILGVRVKGAGMNVYAADPVLSMMDPEYVVPVEAFDARHAGVMKQINIIFYAAFNYDKLDEAQHKMVKDMVKPEDISEFESERWDNALHWYEQSKGWAKEREAARQVKPFYQHFFAGVVTEKKVVFEDIKIKGKTPFITRPAAMVELHVEDIIGDTLYRAETGQLGWGLGFEDLTTSEFVRYLDENAIDVIYDVILNGKEYSIVGGNDRQKELTAGALQEMLQNEINYTWVRGVRRDATPLEALLKLKVSDEVKGYIAEVVGLLK